MPQMLSLIRDVVFRFDKYPKVAFKCFASKIQSINTHKFEGSTEKLKNVVFPLES